ncbi:hypothetical protein SAMN02949497_2398 [Methylomagnum ishizawai]|uniref:Uncharacterized protein n=1 Tax=Methylomagnum ishizawai TaxID=1760988 RepID=A0A1Y6D3T5_9GAMM|nr:hypothetical protein [Methylomagnum ishizawai]SMF95054.1 hypothetical protein SAMN02949497_2398 [Methylomagnum ishizawai]
MHINEVVELVKGVDPALLKGIPDKKVAKIIREAFVQVSNQVENTEEGVIAVPGLGRFQIRKLEREVNGQTVFNKRVIFKLRKAVTSDTAQDQEAEREEA